MLKFITRIGLSALFVFSFISLSFAESDFLRKQVTFLKGHVPHVEGGITLSSIDYKSGKGFIYVYNIDGDESELMSKKDVFKSTEESVLKELCRSLPEDFSSELIKDNTPIVYEYRTPKNKLIGKLTLDIKRCVE